jgi:undecaprenyl-diphosphatase
MPDIEAPPQPGSPEQAHRLLPLGALGSYLVLSGIFCVLATLGFAWLARGVFGDRFVALDEGMIRWLHGYWGPASDRVMLFVTTLGDTLVLGPLIALAVLGLLRRGRWIDAAGLILAGGGGGLLNQLLKVSFERVRPELFLGPLQLTSYSFPSGHSMGAITCYGMLAFVAARLVRGRVARLALALAAWLLVLSIGLSRIYFGVHYPTDVIGGYLAGSIWLAISIVAVLIAEERAERQRGYPSSGAL